MIFFFTFSSLLFQLSNVAQPVPACLTTKMPSVTSLPKASVMSWKNDQGRVILQQLILVDRSLPFADILKGSCTKAASILLMAVCVSCFFVLNQGSAAGKRSSVGQREVSADVCCAAMPPSLPPLPQNPCPLFFSWREM